MDRKQYNGKQITLYDILNTEPIKFTLREIEEMMDEELSKDPDEIDTEFISICADVINRAHAEEDNEQNLMIAEIFNIKGVSCYANNIQV
ncbi:MAG: hypothetical protein K2G60_06160 [Oscillospiraceae bacterium]|nr:hypothetical protein [Oscillospiraceae bacterium]